MFSTFADVKGLDAFKLDGVRTDNNVFRLHYKATFAILLTACILVTANQYIGDPIDCIVEEIPAGVRIVCYI